MKTQAISIEFLLVLGVDMGLGDQTAAASIPHLYPQELQLKLYQAFIFSVPILFSIILLLLFYLFYLKRRRDSNLISPSIPSTNPNSTTFNHQSPLHPLHIEVELKEELRKKLPILIFDEDLRAKYSLCCVCLGEYELREQLHQIPSCGHVFHIDCIHHWLCANSTCPLCRRFIFPAPHKKMQDEASSV